MKMLKIEKIFYWVLKIVAILIFFFGATMFFVLFGSYISTEPAHISDSFMMVMIYSGAALVIAFFVSLIVLATIAVKQAKFEEQAKNEADN